MDLHLNPAAPDWPRRSRVADHRRAGFGQGNREHLACAAAATGDKRDTSGQLCGPHSYAGERTPIGCRRWR